MLERFKEYRKITVELVRGKTFCWFSDYGAFDEFPYGWVGASTFSDHQVYSNIIADGGDRWMIIGFGIIEADSSDFWFFNYICFWVFYDQYHLWFFLYEILIYTGLKWKFIYSKYETPSVCLHKKVHTSSHQACYKKTHKTNDNL